MYGPKWPFLLMYETQVFRRLTVVNGTPRDLGRHKIIEFFNLIT